MRKTFLLFSTLLLTGCLAEPDLEQVRKFVSESVSDCSGVVGDIILVRESLLSHKFAGFAEVTIDGESFTPDLLVYTDGETSFFKLEQDACALDELERSVRKLQRLFR
jgi:hypothetical protein